MAKNSNLNKAKTAQNDEFYTQISDIERECKYYREHFNGATVFCNCDDPEWSNFWRFFHLNFEFLGLKKLISTHYHEKETTYKMEYKGGNDNDTSVGIITPLKTNGDFRSPECIELLKESSIVITNPPFSLFREYLAQLMEYDKKFLILGNMNASHYKEIFPLIQDNKMWFGYTAPKEFIQPDKTIKKFGNILWYTNLDIVKRHEPLDLIEKYNPDSYPKYDNYDAIEVNKVVNIPCDYYGVMGVPDGFLNVYNPDQFIILGCTQRGCHDNFPDTKKYNDYREMRQNGERTGSSGVKTNENANLERNDSKHNYYINDAGHIVQSTFSRIFIKRKLDTKTTDY